MRSRRAASAAVVAATLLCASAASANRDDYTVNDWPVQVLLRPLTLAPKMSELRGDTVPIRFTPEVSFTLAPDLYRGITRRLTLGVLHQRGFCLEDESCGSIYNDVAIELTGAAIYRGPIQLAVRLGPEFPRFSRFFFGVRAGVTARFRTGRFALLTSPTLYAGIVGRNDETPGENESPLDYLGRRESIDAPIAAQVQVTDRLAFSLTSGVSGPLSNFTDAMEIPIGIAAVVAINFKVDFGGEVRFLNAFGGQETSERGFSHLAVILRAALRY